MTRRVGLVICAAIAVLAAGCDWTAPRYGPGNTGSNDTETVLSPATAPGLEAQWKVDAGWLQGPPVIRLGIVYSTASLPVSGDPARVQAHRAGDGSLVWSREVGSIGTGPTTANGRVLVGTQNSVIALDAASGALVWERSTAGPPPTPTVAGGVAYVASTQVTTSGPTTEVLALDVLTGAERWAQDVEGFVEGPMAVGDGRVHLATSSTLHALQVADGTPLYAVDHSTGVRVLADGRLFGSDLSGAISATDAATGLRQWWSPALGRAMVTSMAYRAGSVFTCNVLVSPTFAHLVRAFDATDGSTRWTTNSAGCSSVVHANGVVYVAEPAGIRLLAADDGTMLGVLPVDGAVAELIVANGSVYAAIHHVGGETSTLMRLALP